MAYHNSTLGLSHGNNWDTFFVEGEGPGAFPQRVGAKARAKELARITQDSLASELAKVTAAEYKQDIVECLLNMEYDGLPDVNSIDIQTEIKWYMRPYLIEFLIEAHAAYQLLPETLHLAINLLDRYCSRRVVHKRHYQLVGCSALLVAAKYGDSKDRVPLIKELKSMCCSLYDDDMFVQMEWHLLNTLEWQVGYPTVESFVHLALSEKPYDAELERMTWYFCETALFHKEFVSTPPSVMASAALALALAVLGRADCSYTGWASQSDADTVYLLYQKLHNPSPVLAKKYSSTQNACVAATMDSFLRRQMSIQPEEIQNSANRHPAATPMSASKPDAMPHTPQKGQMAQGAPHGYMTPPITPDGPAFATNTESKGPACYGSAQSNLTPPSTLEDLSQPQVRAAYSQNAAMWSNCHPY
ncbi:MAG: hypothetical protein M1831_003620 [Alyxoria varia]|nr:MAG: hypothetical protein M1831_003620 [Alyxoria varia]